MKLKKYYDVHGLLNFSIEGEEKQIEYLCKQCEYFSSNKPVEREDIRVCIGPFTSICEEQRNCRIINRKYFVDENVVFAEDTYKTAHWKIQIEDLDSDQTKFYFDGNGWTKYILHKSFLESLLRYKLNQKGFLMVHASSVSINGKGTVFAASPEAGKTSTMLNYLELGQAFMSDDFSLLGNGTVYSYPTPITLHSHNLKRHPFLSHVLSSHDKREIFWRTMVLKATLGMGDISYKIDIWEKLTGTEVAAQVPLAQIVLLTKYTGEKVKQKPLERQAFIEKLLIVNHYETLLFNNYLKAYYYHNLQSSENDFWEKMRSNAKNILTKPTYYELLIPKRFSRREFEDLKTALQSLSV